MLITILASDNDTLLTRVRHHAKQYELLVLEILSWTTLILGATEDSWVLRQSRGGPNSFSLVGLDGRAFHFRGGHETPPVIRVYDSAREGNLVVEIKTRADVRRFIESLPAPVAAAA